MTKINSILSIKHLQINGSYKSLDLKAKLRHNSWAKLFSKCVILNFDNPSRLFTDAMMLIACIGMIKLALQDSIALSLKVHIFS